jgi:glutamate synthase (NADPH/NADH) large chain
MGLPERQGLYDPRNEHNSCGIGFVANIKGPKSHDIISCGLQILVNLDHLSAVGADTLVGDGAAVSYRCRTRCCATGRASKGHYAVAMCFLLSAARFTDYIFSMTD